MPTPAERISLAIDQYRHHNTLICDSTHEAWLLAKKAYKKYDEISCSISFEKANRSAVEWIIEEILEGRSKESYTAEEYVAAGGEAGDYPFILEAQKGWAAHQAGRAEYLRQEKEGAKNVHGPKTQ